MKGRGDDGGGGMKKEGNEGRLLFYIIAPFSCHQGSVSPCTGVFVLPIFMVIAAFSPQ